jgi:hypothetical protein
MVKLGQPFEVLITQPLNDTSYNFGLQPFPRSTYLMEDEDGKQVIYLVDRNYMFMRYDINNFTEKEVNRDFSFPLNRTILNNTCSDLQREQPYNNITIILCQTVTFDPLNGRRKVLNTIV